MRVLVLSKRSESGWVWGGDDEGEGDDDGLMRCGVELVGVCGCE